MDQVIQRYKRYETMGNGVLLFLVNDRAEKASAIFDMALLPALNHFGLPYRIVDVQNMDAEQEFEHVAGIVLAHDGVTAAMTEEQWKTLQQSAAKGIGVACLDGELASASAARQQWFGFEQMTQVRLEEIRVQGNGHYVTELQNNEAVHRMLLPVPASAGRIGELADAQVEALLSDADDGVLAAAVKPADANEGARVALAFSPVLWMRQYFGHASGLDDLIWRSLVWIAKKPFATLMLPPFAVCRVDDCVGSYDEFAYLGVLNEYGWITNVGLFVDDIDEANGKAIKHYYDAGIAEFSAHSFHELGEPAPDQIYIKHDGTEYTFDELEEHFARLDRFFGELDITPSETVNIHFDELGLNSLPFLLNRNQGYMMSLIPAGVHWYANSYSWEPYPYGHQGFNYGPMDPDYRFWTAIGHHLGGYKTPDTGMGVGEFLGGCTTFDNECDHTDVAKAIQRGMDAIKLGVGSGFFGTLMTHEQRVAATNPDDWRAMIAGIHEGIKHLPLIYVGYDHISKYCKDKARTRVAEVQNTPDGQLIVKLEGRVEHGLYYHLYEDNQGRIENTLVEASLT